ncbi:MAG TPA: MBL fold metallo-hydrolase [Syntrophales bacterium]|nr:MBL fold metallo-hydrolase [Syntrophales bacterium]
MTEKIMLQPLEKIEILTLQDNYVEVTAMDNSEVITRASAIADNEIRRSISAEHGFAAIVRATDSSSRTRTLLFDFGFSDSGAAENAKLLGADMTEVEAMALSHGHSDHTGGIETLAEMIGKKGIEFVVHPGAFRPSRFLKYPRGLEFKFPSLTRERLEKAGVRIVESDRPRLLLDGTMLFLGEIERKTDFERGMPNAFYKDEDGESWDPIPDDTAVALHLRGKGLVVLSGCSHSGIVNTVLYARKITGIENVHAVMGGFHLSGPAFDPIVPRTTEELKKLNLAYIIPCHCTGRKSIQYMEREMPEAFIMNMAGTRLTFRA